MIRVKFLWQFCVDILWYAFPKLMLSLKIYLERIVLLLDVYLIVYSLIFSYVIESFMSIHLLLFYKVLVKFKSIIDMN